jgi:hypothetical protein
MQVFERGERLKVRLATRWMRRSAVITVLFLMVPAATTAVAQESAGTVTETVTTRRDLNGRDAVSERVSGESSNVTRTANSCSSGGTVNRRPVTDKPVNQLRARN